MLAFDKRDYKNPSQDDEDVVNEISEEDNSYTAEDIERQIILNDLSNTIMDMFHDTVEHRNITILDDVCSMDVLVFLSNYSSEIRNHISQL